MDTQKMRKSLLVSKLSAVLLLLPSIALCQRANTDTAPLVVAMSLFAGGYSLAKHDTEGLKDFVEATFINLTVTDVLKNAVNKKRPDGGTKSFPSGHTSQAATSASYMGYRYGPWWGVGFGALTAFVGAERIHHEKHDMYDVAAGALIGWLSAAATTKGYDKYKNVKIMPHFSAEDKAYGVNFQYNF